MAIESDVDRAVFFDTDDFGTAATIDSATVYGQFDVPHDESMEIVGEVPTFQCRSSDVSSLSRGDTVTIGAVAYVCQDIQSDGTGMTLLILEEPD